MPKRKYTRPKVTKYRRPRCAHCGSLEVLRERGVQPNGDLYVKCKDCGGQTKCVEIDDQ